MASTHIRGCSRWLAGLLLAATAVFSFLFVLELGLRGRRAWRDRGARRETSAWTFYEYDPVLGWRNRAGADGFLTIPDSRTRVKINSHNLRDVDRTYEKTGRCRILVLGDSFTWGFGVEQTERFTERLQDALGEEVEVINSGVTGYGTDQELLFLEREGARYQPDIVVLAFGLEDPINNHSAIQYSYPKPYFMLHGDGLVLRNVPVPKKAADWQERFGLPPGMVSEWAPSEPPPPPDAYRRLKAFLRLHLLSYEFVRGRLERLAALRSGRAGTARADPLTEALCLRMRAFAASHGQQLVVLMVPYREQIEGGRALPSWEAFKSFFASQGIACIDPSPGLVRSTAEGRRQYLLRDPHWNAGGHRTVAEALRVYLGRAGSRVQAGSANMIQRGRENVTVRKAAISARDTGLAGQ